MIKKIRSDYLYYYTRCLYKKDPKLAANYSYRKLFGKDINWVCPADLNEIVRWMLVNTDTRQWTQCADKYAVREYIKDQGCGDYLVKLYGKWDNPEDISFDSISAPFVLKANNGCGTVKIIRDKSLVDLNQIKSETKQWLKRPFGYVSGEFHYLSIPPCIIAEELLDNTSLEISSSLIDYKIWCINGQPECILVCFNRKDDNLDRIVYDLEWKPVEGVLRAKSSVSSSIEIPKPKCFDEMLEIAQKLAIPFPEVRVDLYVIDDRPKFGELTFSAGMKTFTKEYYEYLGHKIDFTNLTRNQITS